MIKYKKRRKYKYNLHSKYTHPTGIAVTKPKKTGYVQIDAKGNLLIKAGYAWDGPSGPTIDTKNFMRGSLVHDALYQLMRERVIKQGERDEVDKLLKDICRADGMSRIRAWWVYQGVKFGGASSAKPDMLTAP